MRHKCSIQNAGILLSTKVAVQLGPRDWRGLTPLHCVHLFQGNAGGRAAPSAPPMPSAPAQPSGSAAAAGSASQPPSSDRDFWSRALQTPVEQQPGKGAQVAWLAC